MIYSRHEWNIEYLRELREKFLDKDYPLKTIHEEYSKTLQISRKDLISNQNRKKKITVIAPLVLTFNPGNPQVKKWINQEMNIMHEDPKLKQN